MFDEILDRKNIFVLVVKLVLFNYLSLFLRIWFFFLYLFRLGLLMV